MGMLDHWHPMLPSRQLRNKPVAVQLAGKEIALFRISTGEVGALHDMCPHRRMRLSLGNIVGDRLQCRYHGWTFTCDGQGESPGTPKLHACASIYEVREQQGYIWLKSRESQPAFPKFNTDGFVHMCNLEHRAKAPLDVTVDNFCEIEHTPVVHEIFGYGLDHMKDVTVRFESTENSVRVINSGPPKSLGFFTGMLVGIKKNYIFNDDWTTYFSPVYSVYEHWWSDPDTGKEAMVRWRLYMFFTPVNDKETRVTTFAYAKSRWPLGRSGGIKPFRFLMRKKLAREIDLDVKILEGLASFDASLEGMKLSRFDRALGLNRERIERVYRGNGLGKRVALSDGHAEAQAS